MVDRLIDRSCWLPGDPWDAPGATHPRLDLSAADAPAAERDGIGRFVKGVSGNPAGRPPGTKTGTGRFRAGTRAAAALLDAQAEALTEKLVEMALAGDPVAVRFCLARLLGTRRGQPVEIDLLPVAAPADLAGAVTAVAAAIAEGSLTPEEGMQLSRMLAGFPRALAAGAGAQEEELTAEDAREELALWLSRLAAEEDQARAEAAAAESTA
jgi:hypothetical protein